MFVFIFFLPFFFFSSLVPLFVLLSLAASTEPCNSGVCCLLTFSHQEQVSRTAVVQKRETRMSSIPQGSSVDMCVYSTKLCRYFQVVTQIKK